jgi:hypothetical protein
MECHSAPQEHRDTERREIVVGNDAGIQAAGLLAVAPVDFALDINAGEAFKDFRIAKKPVVGKRG